ncbi:hypothetical protein EQM13_13010 [Acidilutibacter cellobiosedens]|jgi:tetratricopeptide (TPR) repeat protein|uniref:Tetratricopeptide repeat protein n=1 Tax=Acidilutibacter cellobiosedens TaxID=2507161 RepID=A0A410QF08_9FIRM|nr:hypothetical protein [Acidilutibacter cellobiosedens]QAT62418.1 hypothetical protein EQM13_13010 [Acidilutibacter cellobiosedens]
MVKDENITVGQNLKRIRKELELKQYSITGGKITRNLISLIENDKTPLYEDNAKIIAENMNSNAMEKNMNIYIEPEDILDPKRYDAKKDADVYIEGLRKRLEENHLEIRPEELQKVELFLNNWNLSDKKIIIYELWADMYYKARDFENEHMYLTKAWEYSFMYPKRKGNYRIISNLISNCINSGKYEEAIRLGNLGLLSQKNLTDNDKKVFHYNNALAYSYLNKFDDGLRELAIAKKYNLNANDKLERKILVSEGFCYVKKGEYGKALNAYNLALRMLNTNKNYDELCLIYTNMMEVFVKSKDSKKISEYLNLVINLLHDLEDNSSYIIKIYLEIANAYLFLKKYNSSEEYLLKALKVTRINDEKDLHSKILLKLFNLYIEKNEIKKIDDLMEEFVQEVSNIQKDDRFVLLLNLILYNKEEKNKDFVQKILNKGGK